MPPAALSLKVGADISEYSRNLNQAAQQFTRFGGQIDRSVTAFNRSVGGMTAATGKLAQGFNIAGQAAGMFSGLSGIAGIATSLVAGGPVLAGLAALAFAISLVGRRADENKEKLAAFKTQMDAFEKVTREAAGSQGQHLKGAADFAQQQYNAASAALKKLQDDQAAAIKRARASGVSPAQAQITTDIYYKERIAAAIAEVDRLAMRQKIVGDVFNDVMTKMAGKAHSVAEAVKEITLNLQGLGARAGFIGSLLAGPSNITKGFTGTERAAASTETRIGDFIAPMVRMGDISQDSVNKLSEVRQVIQAGFAELPNALGAVLGPLIGALFGGNQGSQVGGGLGAAFGGGVGTKLGAGVASVLGSAALPVVGTLLGGLLGGAIGSLFGGAKKKVSQYELAMDQLAKTTERVNEAISNLPTGIKVAYQRFLAAIPLSTNPTQPPGTPTMPVPIGGPRGLRPTGGAVVYQFNGPVTLNGVSDPQTFERKMGAQAQRSLARGGTTALRVAMRGT